MSQAILSTTTIPRPLSAGTIPSELDRHIHNAGRKLMALQMTRVVGDADKADAQNLVRDILDIAKIVDDAFLEIGRYAQHHFGSIDLNLFTDQLLGAVEGSATFDICHAVEQRMEEQIEWGADTAVASRAQLRRA